jgi:cell division protein FtsN
MARDYKNRAHRRKKSAGVSPWAGVIGGLLIGLFVAFLVFIKMQAEPEQPGYEQQTLAPPAETIQQDVRDVRNDQKDTIPPPPKPRFDFYTLLPEMEVVIPEEEISEGLKQPAPPVPPVKKAAPVEEAKPAVAVKPPKPVAPVVTTTAKQAKPPAGSYYLQVGSFKNGVQAERFRAELALLGMQTNIQKVTINNKDTYHRVRVGPFYSFEALDKTRQTLKKKGIESTPIKITG